MSSPLIGLKLEEAIMLSGLTIRPMCENGEMLIGTCDYRPDRVNVATVDGIITEILGLG